jgi:leader peptidase (prepilin peptidase) / N-methyltransferase
MSLGDGSATARLGRAHFWTSIAAGILAAGLSLALLPPIPAVFSALLAALAIWIACVDLDRLIIPDLANAALFALGLGLVIIETPPADLLEALADALMRAVLAGGLLWLVRFSFARLAGREGLGLGDVKLMAAGAPFLAWTTLPYVLLLAAGAAILVVGLRSIRQGQWIDRATEIPFGAFLAPAIWVAFLLERLELL